eukprot:3711710-Pyramimonas_sp.AAC.1
MRRGSADGAPRCSQRTQELACPARAGPLRTSAATELTRARGTSLSRSRGAPSRPRRCRGLRASRSRARQWGSRGRN